MRRMVVTALMLMAGLPAAALAQTVTAHGQTWNMRQTLSAPVYAGPNGIPMTRTERLRQISREAEARRLSGQQPAWPQPDRQQSGWQQAGQSRPAR